MPINSNKSAIRYVVKKGDTVNSIVQRYGYKNYRDAGLKSVPSGNFDSIREGDVLNFGRPSSTPTPTPTPPPAPTPQGGLTLPQNSDPVTRYINANQENDLATAVAEQAPPVRGQEKPNTLARFQSALDNRVKLPSRPNFSDTFEDLREKYSLDDLEQRIVDLDAEEADLRAQFRVNRDAERGKTVATNVIQGRVGEHERAATERIDFVQRQKQRVTSEINVANSAIENLINFKKLDYDTAKAEYDTEFSQTINLFNTIRGQVNDERAEENRDQDNARANLQIIYNAIKDGSADISSVDATMQAKINSLEVKSGLPQGFYSNIQASKPKAKIISTTTRVDESNGNKYADVLFQNPDNSFTTQSVYQGNDGSGSDDTISREVSFEEYLDAAQKELLISISPTSDLYQDLQAKWDKDYPLRSSVPFTPTDLKKLEQAGLLGKSRKEQIDYLYKPKDDSIQNPFDS